MCFCIIKKRNSWWFYLEIPVIEGLWMTEVVGSPFCINFNDFTNFTACGINGGIEW